MPGDLLSRSLIEIAAELRAKRVTARELVETAIPCFAGWSRRLPVEPWERGAKTVERHRVRRLSANRPHRSRNGTAEIATIARYVAGGTGPGMQRNMTAPNRIA